ncbi:MAG: response regulator [Hyphomicrobiaceae bacterium]
MRAHEKVNILLVDDQPAKLLSYQAILEELGENLIAANSAREAFERLLKLDVAVILMDVCMPELDGFQLATMLREHPRFENTAIIFVSAILMTEPDLVRGYATGAVDYVSVPIVPEILRAKVRVFADLHRKTRQLERLNLELEQRVADRTSELEASAARLHESEQRLRLASEAAGFGTYDLNATSHHMHCSPRLRDLLGSDAEGDLELESFLAIVHPGDRDAVRDAMSARPAESHELEFRVQHPRHGTRWLLDRGRSFAATGDPAGRVARVTGTILDITERKLTEQRQQLLMAELDHRVKNMLANVSAMARLSSRRAASVEAFVAALDGRIQAISKAHGLIRQRSWNGAELRELVTLLLNPFRSEVTGNIAVEGRCVQITPKAAQSIALVVHELATNAVKYGALSTSSGKVTLSWREIPADPQSHLRLVWRETGGPEVSEPARSGFGLTVLKSVAAELGATIDSAFHRDGLVCTIEGPFVGDTEATNPSASAAMYSQHGAVAPDTEQTERRRILVVEDEPFVALQLQTDLEGEGHEVIGPASSLAQGLKLAQSEGLDAALVDIRLGGDTSATIADQLLARQIPFAFATGYSDSSMLPEHLHAVPRLRKPYALEDVRRIVLHLFTQQDRA